MKHHNKLSLVLIFTLSFLAGGSSRLLTQENPGGISQAAGDDLLSQSNSTDHSEFNVWHHLQSHQSDSYHHLFENFKRAVDDVQTLDENDTSNQLLSLKENNEQEIIHRKTDDNQDEFLMVTWTNQRFYESWTGGETPVQLERTVWVTAKPEVYNFCNVTAGIGNHLNLSRKMMLDLRLTQYLGLKPEPTSSDKSKDAFVELWVKAEHIKRPCSDRRIDQNNCQMDPAKIQEMMQELRVSQTEYPFTGLGYAYDWGKPSPVGPSEFVIEASKEKPVEAKVSLVKNTEEYCNNQVITNP
ncbi:hypothetical protein [Oscillatoria acuminata]|uniref:Uncharacterized protein n=1 Tax=Oscillatoria acuminata PCC 6304 TaxID=56110 RepID=K9TR23_9CYAN|nr:hypothetical protein [Oscillatoria acuminata]AFY85020.1 hypothetical protein Oscil6304_5537 [Oscillatoria acuminata PCC 6304]